MFYLEILYSDFYSIRWVELGCYTLGASWKEFSSSAGSGAIGVKPFCLLHELITDPIHHKLDEDQYFKNMPL